MSELSSWSETDASNSAATPDGWPEGMTPSSVNDCGRAMMGALRRFWSRINGTAISTGAANVYTVAYSVAPSSYVNGETYSFRAHQANSGAATFDAGPGAKAIQKPGASGPTALAGGEIQTKQRVVLVYDSGDDVFVMTSAAPGVGGKVAQIVNTETGAVATGTTILPVDDTIPQNAEGDECMSLSITPTNASSTLVIDVTIFLSHSTNRALVAALFQDSTANALAVGFQPSPNTGEMVGIHFRHKMTAGTTSATTFKVRAGCSAAGTTTFNGSGGLRLFGGVYASSITIVEILP